MAGVGTAILGGPRPLHDHRRPHGYTLNCEEPVILIGFIPLAAVTIIWIVDAFLIPGRVRSLNLRIAATNAAAHAQLGHSPY